MPLDVNTLITQFQSILQAIQPDIDVQKGALKRLFIDPHASIVYNERTQIDRLIGLFTLQRIDSILTSEQDAQVSSFSGMSRYQGRKASGYVTYWSRTIPSSDITIDIGDQVSDSTGTLVYSVTQQVVVPVASLTNFYNPVTQRYEILAPISAVTIGADYEVSVGRITRMLTPEDGVDGVINNSPITNGDSVENITALDTRFRKRLEGQSLGTKGGLISELVNIPSVLDVALVTPADYTLFSRRTDQPALDIYVLGDVETTDNVSFTVTNSAQFTMPSHVITSIVSVTLDGEAVSDYAFSRDTSVLAGSVNETDTIQLSAQPDVGSVVEVEFTYNSLLETVQARANDFGDFAYFGVDLLTYAAIEVPMVVAYTFSYLSSFDQPTILQALQDETMSYLNPDAYVSVLQPEAFIADLQMNVPSAINITLTKFTTLNNSTAPIQVVQFAKNQYPSLQQSNLSIITLTA